MPTTADNFAAGRAYGDSLIADLGDHDALTTLERLVRSLKALLVELEPVDLDAPESEGRWSIRDVIEHFTDGDVVLAYRTRMILAHDDPPIQGYDQELWVNALRRSRGTLEESLEELACVRRRNVRLFRSLNSRELERSGWHDERGAESLDRLMRVYAGHDRRHLRQIRRIGLAVKKG